ncbi:DUF1493 family protein [Tenacibaculum amylolyticum]|uniref:DUF1493 family protein n=1 Tax=Tenacibaculum amylolyticum TaxID=104269 RepID=UPI003895AAB5
METITNIEFIKFIESFSGNYNFVFTRSTLLENDLGITGDDGCDFIKEYAIVFSVDISEFLPSKYFYPEPSLWRSFRNIKIQPLTLGDLENGIIQGYLK